MLKSVCIALIFGSMLFSELGRTENKLSLNNAVLICDDARSMAVTVLQEEIYKRAHIRLPVTHKWPKTARACIVLGDTILLRRLPAAQAQQIRALEAPGAEGYRIVIAKFPAPMVAIIGSDARGIFYGMGWFLRNLALRPNQITCLETISLSSTPRYPLRGHQLGYRPKTNAYDAWSVAQFDQYIRDLAIFGANSIEIMPPRTDDDLTSPLMHLSPLEMMTEQSRIIDSYNMDVWMWYPNMGSDYQHPDSLRFELAERDEVFKKCPRLDALFVPGGDPGDLHPSVLFAWLARLAEVLHKYHPHAQIWISPQAFKPTDDWLEAFYRQVNAKPAWLGGVVFGPWVRTRIAQMRKIVHAGIPIRRYPDITHSISCQYPVPQWDLAFAMTLGRECINPRPLDEKQIHNALADYAIGSIAYSEGSNDDVNKFVWLAQDWDPDTPVLETLRDYGRLFIGPAFADDFAQALLALERNWRGPLLTNTGVPVTLQQWQDLERRADAPLGNYRFQMHLLRAYYDAYERERLIYETMLEQNARILLRSAPVLGSLAALQQAENMLAKARLEKVSPDLHDRCQALADSLFRSIGAQLTVGRHGAISLGRGAFIDAIDEPLNDVRWLLHTFSEIRLLPHEPARLQAIAAVLNRCNPGPGGFYDNYGSAESWHRVRQALPWAQDPGSLASPRVGFGVGLRGEQWVHEVQAKGFESRATPLAWMNQITALYDAPLTVCYDGLDAHAEYRIRAAYTGRFRSAMRLVIDEQYLIHDFLPTGATPYYEFPIPKQALADGRLECTWSCPMGERGAQVAEVWILKNQAE